MHAIAGKEGTKDKKKPRREKKKKEKPTRHLLRAVEEGGGDGGGGEDRADGNDNQSDDEESVHPAFTQEHIAQMFEGELDEFASLTSYQIHSNQRQQQQQSSSSSRGRTRIQYVVENEISGDFFRVKHSNNSNSRTSSAPQRRKPLLFASSMGASASRFSVSLHFGKLEATGDGAGSTWSSNTNGGGGGSLLRDLETALVLMCQGILAGLCWMDAFNLSSSDGVIRKDTRDVFTCTYSAVTDRSRQLFFILFKYPLQRLTKKLNQEAATVAADDGESTDHAAHATKLSTRLLIGAVAFTLAALLALLIAAPAAIRLSHTYQNDSEWCSVNAERSTMFRQFVSLLRTGAVFNAVLMSGAWFCVALQCYIGDSINASNRRLLAELKKSYLRQEKRMDQLYGQQIERLSIDKLKDLIQIHQCAIDATESVLLSKLQLQQLEALPR